MTLKCIIIDDEPIARKLLQEYIEETDFLTLVGSAENPLKAAGLISEFEPDLIFLDVNMPKMNGFQFLKSTPNLPMVIMTTAYGQYALDGFEMAVVDYLVKPFSLERFLKAAQKALELKKLKAGATGKVSKTEEEQDHFFVKCNGRLEKVFYNELIYVEAMANYVTLYTVNNKLIVYLTIKGLSEKLPADNFIQVHKGYIVNIDKIKAIEGNMLHVENAKITVGASYQNILADKVLKDRYFKR